MSKYYDREHDDIRRAFEEGMDELFRTIFTETVYLYLLDEDATTTNVYDETSRKVYKNPYPLTAKVVIGRDQGNEEVQTVQQTAIVTVPNKQLKDLGIPHSTEEDLIALQKGIFVYQNYRFLVDVVKPRTHIAEAFLFYEFECTTHDKDNTVYVLPDPEGSDSP